jgi:hypothetical protein
MIYQLTWDLIGVAATGRLVIDINQKAGIIGLVFAHVNHF